MGLIIAVPRGGGPAIQIEPERVLLAVGRKDNSTDLYTAAGRFETTECFSELIEYRGLVPYGTSEAVGGPMAHGRDFMGLHADGTGITIDYTVPSTASVSFAKEG